MTNRWKDGRIARRKDGGSDDGRHDRRTYGTTAEGQTGKINTPSLMNLFVGSGSEGGDDVTENDAW